MKKSEKIASLVVFTAISITIPFTVYLLSRDTGVGDIQEEAAGPDATVTIDLDKETWENRYGVNLVGKAESDALRIVTDPSDARHDRFMEMYDLMGFSFLRFPNGCNISNFDWTDAAKDDLDAVMDLARDLNTDILFEMSTMGQFDPSGSYSLKNPCGWTVNVRFPIGDLSDPNVYGIKDFVKEYTVDRWTNGQNYIKYYELGNEEWGYWIEELGRYMTPGEYVLAADQVSNAIMDVVDDYPALRDTIRIIGVSKYASLDTYQGLPTACDDDGGVPWGATEFATSDEQYDAITWHPYWINGGWGTDINAPQGESLYALDLIEGVQLKYPGCFPDDPQFHSPAPTEWNYKCWKKADDPNDRRHRNTLLFEHTLFTLGSQLLYFEYDTPFIAYHNMGIVWNTLDEQIDLIKEGCATLALKENDNFDYDINAPGKAFEIINQHFADTHIKTSISSPLVTHPGGFPEAETIIGSSSTDGSKIYTILINRKLDPAQYLETEINFAGYDGDVTYTAYELNAPAFDSRPGDITFTQVATDTVLDGFNVTIRNQSAYILEMTIDECIPNCSGKECGDDGCGKSCGTCFDGMACSNGTCILSSGVSPADINGDGSVSMSDYTLFVEDYLAFKAGDPIQFRSDLNSDNDMTMDDYAIFVEEYLKSKT